MTQPVEILYTVPLGTVIAWYPLPNASLPPGFVYCDGNPINVADSPYNGRLAPDLTNRFILGTGGPVTANQQGGSTNHNLQGWKSGTIETSATQVSIPQDNVQNLVVARNQNAAGYRYDLQQADDNWNDGNHHHQIASLSVPAPGWLALVYIIRIK
jgi:hypothetical protein